MNEENYTCEICCENYDLKSKTKLPKRVPCCKKTFCLQCLNDIYERNNKIFKCPYCRKTSFKLPKDFDDDKIISSRYILCCNCHEKVPQNELYFYQNNFQICSKIDEDTYFFGLGDDSINRGLNLLIGKGQKFNLYSNNSDVMPFILSYNKYNLTSMFEFVPK